jgi:ATP-binding cassette subfamily F protein 3
MGEETARTYLGRFLFSEDDVYQRVDSLSGGERSRLAIALLLLKQANLLVLDEPTNHLDIRTRETLEEMLAGFDGTILFVSHDRFFIDRIATRVWAVADGGLKTYLGNYTDYQRKLGRRQDVSAKSEPTADSPATGRQAVSPPVPARSLDGRLQKSLTQIERDIGKLESNLNELSDAMTVSAIDQDAAAVTRLSREFARVQAELEGAYARWEEITAQFELAAGSAPTR